MPAFHPEFAMVSLDSAGRWILEACDYRVFGLLTIVSLFLFSVWRRWRYKSWPTGTDFRDMALSLVGAFGGVTIFIVFLFTKPPAFDKLSTASFLLIGVAVPSFLFGSIIPKLHLLMFPAQFHKPAEVETREPDHDVAKSGASAGF